MERTLDHPLLHELERCLEEEERESKGGLLREGGATIIIPHKVISFVVKMSGNDEGAPKELDSSGMEALTGASVALLASVFCWISINDGTVNTPLEASLLAFFFLLLLGLSYTLTTFAIDERRKTIREMISSLERILREERKQGSRRAIKDRAALLRQLRERDRCARTMTPTFRMGEWEWVPSNMLVKGDLVALTHGRLSPCNAERVSDGARIARDSRVVRSPPTSSIPAASPSPPLSSEEQQARILIDCLDLELYRVVDSPLATDVRQFLREAKTAQRSYLGYQFNIAFKIEMVASLVFACFFGIVLGGVRYAVSPNGLSWTTLILKHSASFLILLPPQSLTVYRSLLEIQYTTALHRSLAENGGVAPSFWDVARRWLLHGAFDRAAAAGEVNHACLPLAPSTIVRVIGSVTATCVLDEECVLEPEPKVEEVFLLKGGEGRFRLLDCCPDRSVPSGMRFEDPQWATHISSLKPLGLACGVGAECEVRARLEGNDDDGRRHEDHGTLLARGETTATPPGKQPFEMRGLASLMEKERWVPSCFEEFAATIGFRHEDVAGFAPTSRTLLVVGGEAANNSSFMRECNSMATLHGKPALECVVVERLVKPAPSATTPSSTSQPSSAPKGHHHHHHHHHQLAQHTTVPETSGGGGNQTSVSPPLPASTQGPSAATSDQSGATSTTHQLPSPSSSPPLSFPHQPHLTLSGSGDIAPSSTSSPTPVDLPLPVSTISSPAPSPPPPGPSGVAPVNAIPSTPLVEMHLLLWGHPLVLLEYASEYWDGESIWSLGPESKRAVTEMSAQWMKEDFDCVGFAYNAVPPSFHALLTSSSSGAATISSSSPGGGGFPPSDIVVMGPEDDSLLPSPALLPPPSGAHNQDSEPPGERLLAVASMLVRGETVFTGVVGSRQQPRWEVAGLVDDLRRAGVRFVYFSSRDARRTRISADKMGLETDWNTSISLQEAEEEDDLLAEWERKAKMPRGVAAVRHHVESVDDVPLRVSVFTDANPESEAHMLEVLRDYRDVVLSMGTALNGAAVRAMLASDIAVAVMGEPTTAEADPLVRASEMAGALGCSFRMRGSRDAVMELLATGRVCLFNYQQWHHAFISLCYLAAVVNAVAACFTCPAPFTVGHCIFFVWVEVPLMCLPVALRRRSRKSVLREKMPWKDSAAPAERFKTLRFLTYFFLRVTPVGFLVVVLYFWAFASLGGGGDWGVLLWPSKEESESRYPLAASPSTMAGSQAVALLALVWSGNFLVLSFASRNRPEWYIRESFFWYVAALTVSLSVGLQFAFNAAYAATFEGNSNSAFPSGVSPGTWTCLAFLPPIVVQLWSYPLKAHDRKRHEHAMQLLRLDFETRLGQFSPR